MKSKDNNQQITVGQVIIIIMRNLIIMIVEKEKTRGI